MKVLYDGYDLPAKRPPTLTFEVPGRDAHQWVCALRSGKPILINVPGWYGAAHVTCITDVIGDLYGDMRGKVTVIGTGAPMQMPPPGPATNPRIISYDFNGFMKKKERDMATTAIMIGDGGGGGCGSGGAMVANGGGDYGRARPRKMADGLKIGQHYVGSNALTKDWTKNSIKEATAHATELVRSGACDEAFVVKIVRVVRKKPLAVTIQDK